MSKQQALLLDEQSVSLAICNALTEVLNQNGVPVLEISGDLRPIGDIEGFDSLVFVEMISFLSRLLEVDIDPRLVLDRIDGRSLSIDEMASRLAKAYSRQRGSI